MLIKLTICFLNVSVLILFLIPKASADIDSYEIESDDVLEMIFEPRVMRNVMEISDKILRLYPPDRYHYVFVGRSLGFLKALMENQGLKASGIPLSGKQVDLSFNVENLFLKEKYLNHLDVYLPRRDQLDGKQIVLLDFSVSGEGLTTAQKLVRWYYKDTEAIHILAVTARAKTFFNYLQFKLEKSKVVKIDHRLFNHLINSNFDSLAGYGTFALHSGAYFSFDGSKPESYMKLRRWFAKKGLGNLELKSEFPHLENGCRFFLEVQGSSIN